MSAKPRFTSWDDVPLVADIEDASRVLGRSVTNIYRECQAGTMSPAPMPRVGKTTPYQWTKKSLRDFLEGDSTAAEPGYRRQDAPGARRRRNHFGKGKAAIARLQPAS